jgi:OOP family OmpA-OmpF porin
MGFTIQRLGVIGLLVVLAALTWASPAFTAGRVFSLQVKAVQQADEAAYLVKTLEATGFKAFSRFEDTGGKGKWHRIYLGIFATREEAQGQAEKFKADGVIEDYVVRVVQPPDGYGPEALATDGSSTGVVSENSFKGLPGGSRRPEGFEIIVDLSGSITDRYRCNGYSKFEAIFSILKKTNEAIPEYPYKAALRKFGYQKVFTRDDYTLLTWGVAEYDRREYSLAIDDLHPSVGTSPLGWALKASEAELGAMGGPQALIVISDFKENVDFGQPDLRITELKEKYGDDFCLYTINIGPDPKDTALARSLAERSGCGKYYDGCRLLVDQDYFEAMIREIFGVPAVTPRPICVDSDHDNVCDDKDLCPNTPRGAPVDKRGCWIAAYSQFFDHDKAVVKTEFLPRLEAAARIMKENPEIDIVIAGHTDGDGTDKYNQKLGQKRADAVKKVLVTYGVEASRLTARSYGESRPVASNKTGDGKAQNRRVEFHVGDVPARSQ